MANEPREEKKPRPTEAAAEGETKDAKAAGPAAPSRVFALLLVVGLTLGSAAAAVVASTLAAPLPPPAAAANADPAAAATPAPDEKKGEAAKAAEQIITYNLLEHIESKSPLVSNVYRTQQRRYLSINPVFVLKDKATEETMARNQAELVHVLLSLLKTKTLEELDAPEAVNTVAREIQETVGTQLNLGDGIKSVYFTQFVVQ